MKQRICIFQNIKEGICLLKSIISLILRPVGKFKPWLIELTSFKLKLLIKFIMNKPC